MQPLIAWISFWLCLWPWFCLFSGVTFFETDGYGQTQSGLTGAIKAPVIESFSKTEFAVYKGDRVKLQVKAIGPDLSYRWIRASGVFCETLTCQIDTSDWGFGRHRLSFIVFNQFGSLFLTYYVTILNPPPGYKPGDLEAPLVNERKVVEQVTSIDYTVHSMKGKGYSYHGSKVQVIGHDDRSLDWNETLRAQLNALLRFGRKSEESHILFDAGVVHLGRSSPQRRVLVLTRGSLRSRQLRDKMPSFSVLVGDGSTQDGSRIASSSWLQVDCDAKGDFAIIRQELEAEDDEQNTDDENGKLSRSSSVSIQVYSGTARVFLQKGSFGQGEAWIIPAGFEIEIKKPEEFSEESSTVQPEIYPTKIRRLHRILKETSPEYTFGAEIDKSLDGWMLTERKKRQNLMTKAVHEANIYLANGEFFKALENISPFWRSDSDDAAIRRVAAEAYARLGWYDQVLGVFDGQKPKEHQVNVLTLIHLGVSELLESKWTRAYESFSLAKQKISNLFSKIPDPWELGLLEYYLGYAAYKSGNYLEAEKALTQVLENDQLPTYLRNASQGFKRESSAKKMWDLSLGLGLENDTNVLRTQDAYLQEFQDGKFKKNHSLGLVSTFNASAWAYRNLEGQFGARFNFRRVDYSEPSLKDVAPLDQELGIATALGFGLDEITKDAWLEVGGESFLGMRYVGEERALDYMRGSIHIGCPRVLNTYVNLGRRLVLDPLPLRDDLYDPELEELAGANDRSRKLSSAALGVEPFHRPYMKLGLNIQRESAAFRAIENESLNYRDTLGQVYGSFVFPKQIFTHFELKRVSRVFSKHDPKKEYATMNVHVSLGIKDVWYLTHKVSLASSKRSGSIDANNFSRNVYEYIASLDF